MEHIIYDLSCAPDQVITHLPSSLKALIYIRYAQCVGQGLATPGVANACHLNNME